MTGLEAFARSRDAFLQKVGEHCKQTRPLGAEEAARAVFKVLDHYLDPGEMADLKQSLPESVRTLFPVH